MITFINVILSILMMLVLSSKNPVKMSLIILGISATIFMKLILETSTTWPYSILFLLFMGGILVMFMIISSLMPNSKTSKSKLSGTILAMAAMGSNMFFQSNQENLIPQMKWTLMNKNFLWAMILIMTCYFLSFLELMSKDQTPLRSYNCW